MKLRLISAAALLTVAMLAPARSAAQAASAPRDGIVVHITHGAEDPHRLLMGLQMAAGMVDTHDVLVYFDVKGVEAVLKDAPDVAYAQFPRLKEQLANQAIGKSPQDLAPGVQASDRSKFFTFTRGRILTLDY
jgi:hypothetical protein